MTESILNIPPKSKYKKHSEKVFFSYPGDQNHFQTGYYGVTPNASISGSLHLRFPSSDPILATEIELVFKGYEKVQWTEHYGQTTVIYRAIDTFANQQHQLWTSSLSGNYEEIRNMDIPFEIRLPQNLPPSIDIDRCKGKIRYKLIAVVKRKGNLWKFKRKEKSIELSINLNAYIPPPIYLQPFNWNNDSEAVSCGLGYNVTLESSIGSPSIPFIINFLLKFLKQDFKVEKIFFGIKEYHKLMTKKHNKKFSFYLTEKNIKGDEIRLNSNDEANTQIKLEIPERDKNNNTCWTLLDRKHIIVSHKIKIKIYCGGIFTSNIKLENEVQIKNILSENIENQNR